MKILFNPIIISFISIFFSTNMLAQELYWVGGSGNWNDLSHWSNSSGGAQAGYLPDHTIDVYFDLNSGLSSNDTVDVDEGVYDVKNISFKLPVGNQAKFYLAANAEIRIHKDFSTDENTVFVYENSNWNMWHYVGNEDHFISTNGKNMHHIKLSNGGSLTLEDDVYSAKKITIDAGTLNFNGFDMETDWFFPRNPECGSSCNLKVLNIGTSSIKCRLFDISYNYYSIILNGDYSIYCEEFIYFQTYSQPSPISLNRIYLNQNSSDFVRIDCYDCVVNDLIIQNSSVNTIYGNITIENTIEFTEPNAVLEVRAHPFDTAFTLTMNGTVKTSINNVCESLVSIRKGVSTNRAYISKTTGSLTVNNVVVDNFSAIGGANFNLENGLIRGGSTGWNIISSPTSKTYYWRGPLSGVGRWDDPSNWQLSNGSSGCIPTILDNVVFDNSSFPGIKAYTIPEGYFAFCNDFRFINTSQNISLSMEDVTIEVNGDLILQENLSLVFNNSSLFRLNSITNNIIDTKGILLPRMRFHGKIPTWTLESELRPLSIYFFSGSFYTNSFNVETEGWSSSSSADSPISYHLADSYIKVTFIFRAPNFGTFHAGNSLIECGALSSPPNQFYDLRLNGNFNISFNNPYQFNKLMLNINSLTMYQDQSVNELIFEMDSSELIIDPIAELTIEKSISSQATITKPAIIKSLISGTQSDIVVDKTNLCLDGYFYFQDINADLNGTFNAPKGIDGGNNTNINFLNASNSSFLYWIGFTGDWSNPENWAGISGGCPIMADPETADRVTFDRRGLKIQDTVFIAGNQICENIYFNYNFSTVFQIEDNLEAAQINISEGTMHLIGNAVIVNDHTDILDEGLLISEVNEFTTYDFYNEESFLQIKSNCLFTVLE